MIIILRSELKQTQLLLTVRTVAVCPKAVLKHRFDPLNLVVFAPHVDNKFPLKHRLKTIPAIVIKPNHQRTLLNMTGAQTSGGVCADNKRHSRA